MRYLEEKAQLERKRNKPEILLSFAVLMHKHQLNEQTLQHSKGAAEILKYTMQVQKPLK